MTKSSTSRRRLVLAMLAVASLGAPASGAPQAAKQDEGSGTAAQQVPTVPLWLLQGEANLAHRGSTEPLSEGADLSPGDWITTALGGRLEIGLASDAVLRVAGETDLILDGLAVPADVAGASSVLILVRGELLLTSQGSETRIDTPNATVYVGAGVFRLRGGYGPTELVVRRGTAELHTRHGVMAVGEDQAATVDGDGAPVIALAGAEDSLERWARAIEKERARQAACGEDGCQPEQPAGEDWPYFVDSTIFWNDYPPIGCFDFPGGAAISTRPPHHGPPTPPPGGPGSGHDDVSHPGDGAGTPRPPGPPEGPRNVFAIHVVHSSGGPFNDTTAGDLVAAPRDDQPPSPPDLDEITSYGESHDSGSSGGGSMGFGNDSSASTGDSGWSDSGGSDSFSGSGSSDSGNPGGFEAPGRDSELEPNR